MSRHPATNGNWLKDKCIRDRYLRRYDLGYVQKDYHHLKPEKKIIIILLRLKKHENHVNTLKNESYIRQKHMYPLDK